MFSIQTNVNSLIAQENLRVNSDFQGKTIQRLTSGYRINQSGDDAAGLSVANKFRSDVAELTQGVRNANDGISTLQIIDGGMNNIAKMLDRLKTLASQSASQAFTGNRKVVNDEFQTLLQEIDRQSQAIGLDQGGQYAKMLSVFIGGGRAAATGAVDTLNGTVSLDLTSSMVDTQSLGLKGLQVVAGSSDMSGAVESIVQETANTSATTGYSDFYFSGAGFSDGSKVKVSVNLAGVGDMAGLVAAVNSAIENAGNGNSQAAAAFKAAGVTASIHTGTGTAGDTALNSQQLAFTSSSSAFQVEAGDRMANALMGNFAVGSTTTGAALATTVTGGLTAASGPFSPTGKTVRIQGAGLSGPVDLTFASTTATISDAITDLVNKVSASAELKAAGISLSGSAGAALVFTSARGQSFNVMATGDTANQLGLGSFVTNGSAGNKVDYNSITGTSYDYGAAANDQATLQFSLNGAAATAVTVNLTAGDAVAAARTTSVISNPNIVTGTNDTLTFSVDGIDVTATLSASSAASITGSGDLFAGSVTITAASAGVKTATGAAAVHNFTSPAAFTVTVDGEPAQTVTLSGNYANGNDYAAAINTQVAGVTATYDGDANRLSITSNKVGAGSTVSVTNVTAATAATAAGGGAVTAHDFGAGGVVSFVITGAGVTNGTISLSGNLITAQNYVDAINATPGLTGAEAFVSGAGGDQVSIRSTTTGPTSTLTITDDAGSTHNAQYVHITAGAAASGVDTPIAYMGLTGGAGTAGAQGNNQFIVSSTVAGNEGPQTVTLTAGAYTGAQMVDELNIQLNAVGLNDDATPDAATNGVTASLSGNNLVLSTSTHGPAAGLFIAASPLNSALGAGGIGIAADSDMGSGATAASIAADIQSAIDTATGIGAGNAHATVTVNTNGSMTITNDHKGASHTISAFTGNAAVGATNILGTGAAGAAAGLNRTGLDMQNYLNQVFSSDATLQPAQLEATWTTTAGTAGTLEIASGNDTNFRINSGSTGSGVVTGSQALTDGHDWSGAGSRAFRIRVDGTLSANVTLSNATTTAAEALAEVQRALSAASVTGVTASLDGSDHLVFTSDWTGASSNIQVEGPSAGTSALTSLGMKSLQKTADANLGFGVSGASFTANLSTTTSKNYVLDAGGASSAIESGHALSFSALKFGNDAQTVTISAIEADGTQRSATITLKNIDAGGATDNRAGRSIDEAISYINEQLQQSNVASLKKIVAVKENNGGDEINFISSLSSFKVSVASTANADGINGGAATNVDADVVGEGNNISVSTKEDALTAVTAISAAIGKLGSAQAAVGRGQNQLSYALSLAQSQISSFSAAESRIRDADVAAEAANLTKAQVLQQASIAAMAQANSAPQAVLSLLRG